MHIRWGVGSRQWAVGSSAFKFSNSQILRNSNSQKLRNLEKIRIDKWLWSVRIFKSRTKASDACKSGKVRIGEAVAKPSEGVAVGQTVYVKKGGFSLEFLVKKLIGKRVSASLAAECYDNLTPAEEMDKYKDWFVGKAGAEQREKGVGRPTKRERRDIDEFKDIWFE